MATQNFDYYRQRADEELAAAERAGDPAISQIHREMAQRYRDLLNDGSARTSGGLAQPVGEAAGELRTQFG